MSKQQPKLKIGITIGDINGIGPELVLKAFQDPRLKELCIPILYGSSRVINIYRKILNIQKFHYVVVQNANQAQYKKLNVIECLSNIDRIEVGKASEMGGKSALLSLQRALQDAQHESLDALVTLPVDKASLQNHEPGFLGHTEMLTKAFGANESLMLMVSEDLRIGTVTNHLPVSEVARNISTNRIVRKARVLNQSLKNDFNIQKPLIAILGLNPHAGDNGLIGPEEEQMIIPAIQQLESEGILAQGPFPADGFFGSLSYRKYDAILGMYHDQALIPFKLLTGYSGVNFTAGLPFVRTSPDHGVAYDIAGKDLADAESLRQSIYMALDIYRIRKTNIALQANALKPEQIKLPSNDNGVDEEIPEQLEGLED